MSDGKTLTKENAHGESIQEFQQLLRSGGVWNNPDSDYLAELQQRLAKVRRMGGAFEEIGFSPDIEILLNKTGLASKATMASV